MDVVLLIDMYKILVYVGEGIDYYVFLYSLIIGLFYEVLKIGKIMKVKLRE